MSSCRNRQGRFTRCKTGGAAKTWVETPFDSSQHDLMAALIWRRFGRNHDAAREAWSRLLQNYGWDDEAHGRREWRAMVERGEQSLRAAGWKSSVLRER